MSRLYHELLFFQYLIILIKKVFLVNLFGILLAVADLDEKKRSNELKIIKFISKF